MIGSVAKKIFSLYAKLYGLGNKESEIVFETLLLKYKEINKFKSSYPDLKLIDDVNLKKYKKSDTIFILGSGYSINNITNEQWTQIAKNDSVGFNLFFTHDFVPTFYFIEMWKEFVDITKLILQRKSAYKEIPVIYRYMHTSNLGAFSHLLHSGVSPNEVASYSDKVFFNITTDYMGLTKNEWIDVIKWYNKNPFFKLGIYNQIQQAASICALIIFSYALGYKNIVLMGVDLNDNRYFWDDTEKYNSDIDEQVRIAKNYNISSFYERTGGEYDKNSSTHVTANSSITQGYKSISIVDMIEVLKENLLDKENINLYIGHNKSLLFPYLKLYQ
jgi:hypothetical protein